MIMWLPRSGREIRIDDAAMGINHHVVGIHADLVQHGAEQRHFVLAVSVLMFENVRGRMGLQAADPDFNGDVADLLLHVGSKQLHFLKRVGNAGGKLSNFLLQRG